MHADLLKVLARDFSGTIADFRCLAAKELNGTGWRSLRCPPGPRTLLVVCMTGEHEISKLGTRLPAADPEPVDWDKTPLMEGVVLALMTRAIIYLEERNSEKHLTSVVFISAVAESTRHLEELFRLPE